MNEEIIERSEEYFDGYEAATLDAYKNIDVKKDALKFAFDYCRLHLNLVNTSTSVLEVNTVINIAEKFNEYLTKSKEN